MCRKCDKCKDEATKFTTWSICCHDTGDRVKTHTHKPGNHGDHCGVVECCRKVTNLHHPRLSSHLFSSLFAVMKPQLHNPLSGVPFLQSLNNNCRVISDSFLAKQSHNSHVPVCYVYGEVFPQYKISMFRNYKSKTMIVDTLVVWRQVFSPHGLLLKIGQHGNRTFLLAYTLIC